MDLIGSARPELASGPGPGPSACRACPGHRACKVSSPTDVPGPGDDLDGGDLGFPPTPHVAPSTDLSWGADPGQWVTDLECVRALLDEALLIALEKPVRIVWHTEVARSTYLKLP